MSMYDHLTEEEECAFIKGYLAARAGQEQGPPETYKKKTVLLTCWYWGYSQAENPKALPLSAPAI